MEGYLKESFPDVRVDDEGDFMFRHEDTVTWIRPVEWDDGRILVNVWSITNEGMRVDGELTKFLLTTNAGLGLGGFRLDEKVPAVLFVHSFLGDYLNKIELQAGVTAVTMTAAQYAGQIRARFGGRLFVEP